MGASSPRRDSALRLSLPVTAVPVGRPVVEERASRRELVLLGVYFLTVIVVTDVLNVRLGIELLVLTVVVAAVGITRRPVAFLRDWWFLLLGLVLWNLSGPIAAQSPFPWHLDFMYALDRALFFGRDPVVVVREALHAQDPIGPLDWASAAIYNLHLPEPFVAAYMLWRIDRTVYFQFAAAVLVLLVVGMITFVLFPAVPPWMAGEPLVRFGGQYMKPWIAGPLGYPGGTPGAWADARVYVRGVVNGFGLVLRSHPLPFHGSPLFTVFALRGDPVAAFPSEHAAFPLLEFLAFRLVAPRVAWLLAGYVLVVLFVIVFLGEHWVTDALAGYVYAVVIWAAVRRLSAGSFRFSRV